MNIERLARKQLLNEVQLYNEHKLYILATYHPNGTKTYTRAHFICIYYSAPVGVRSIVINPSVCLCICLSASISLEPLDRSARNFVCGQTPVAVARSSSGGVALRYVLPVLRMTSRLAVMGATPERVGSTQRRRSFTCGTGAESDVYECLLY